MSRKRGVVADRGRSAPVRTEPITRRQSASNEELASSQRGKYWTMFLGGLLLGLVFHFLSNLVKSWVPQDDSLAARNSLLVSQQLDQLFRKIDEGVGENPDRFEAYLGLLQTFYVYDQRFVEQNEGNVVAATEKANAEQRLGLCAKVFGNFESAKSHYRKAKQTLDSAVQTEPKSIALFRDCLDVQTTIAELEQASGNADAGRQEFNTAMQILSHSNDQESLETTEWLAPQYRTMATLAMKLGLNQEATELANRYVQSLQRLVTAYPNDDQWRQQFEEAKLFLEQFNQVFQPAQT